jgi:hypothetical protein
MVKNTRDATAGGLQSSYSLAREAASPPQRVLSDGRTVLPSAHLVLSSEWVVGGFAAITREPHHLETFVCVLFGEGTRLYYTISNIKSEIAILC